MMWYRRKKLPDPREAEPFWPEGCPKCGSDKLQKVVFGIPTENEKLLGRCRMAIFLGCDADLVNLPHWYCKKCKHGWQDKNDFRCYECKEWLKAFSKSADDL